MSEFAENHEASAQEQLLQEALTEMQSFRAEEDRINAAENAAKLAVGTQNPELQPQTQEEALRETLLSVPEARRATAVIRQEGNGTQWDDARYALRETAGQARARNAQALYGLKLPFEDYCVAGAALQRLSRDSTEESVSRDKAHATESAATFTPGQPIIAMPSMRGSFRMQGGRVVDVFTMPPSPEGYLGLEATFRPVGDIESRSERIVRIPLARLAAPGVDYYLGEKQIRESAREHSADREPRIFLAAFVAAAGEAGVELQQGDTFTEREVVDMRAKFLEMFRHVASHDKDWQSAIKAFHALGPITADQVDELKENISRTHLGYVDLEKKGEQKCNVLDAMAADPLQQWQ